MSIDLKIISEIERYKNITKYILEQDVALGDQALVPPADTATAPAAASPPPPPTDNAATPEPAPPKPEPIDVENDPDVEKIDDEEETMEKGGDTEELDVTELVDSQKTIQTKQEEYFQNLFNQLSNLESKLSEMDSIVNKLNSLENKIEKYRERTPQEKLNLRVFDSYPYNQRLTDFFDDKKEEMEKTGKNDYVLTSDDVTNINVNDIKNSFQPGQNPSDEFEFKR